MSLSGVQAPGPEAGLWLDLPEDLTVCRKYTASFIHFSQLLHLQLPLPEPPPGLVLVCLLVIAHSDHRQQVTNGWCQVLSYQWGPGGNARGS